MGDLPYPKDFNFRLLLQHFQKRYGEGFTRELLSAYLLDGTINGTPVHRKLRRGGERVRNSPYWECLGYSRLPSYYVDGPIIDYIVTQAEVLRFEADHPTQQEAAPPSEEITPSTGKRGVDETPEEYTTRRRAEGVKDFDIAWELYKQGTSQEMIGRILLPEPPTSEPTTYTKRGKKILGIK